MGAWAWPWASCWKGGRPEVGAWPPWASCCRKGGRPWSLASPGSYNSDVVTMLMVMLTRLCGVISEDGDNEEGEDKWRHGDML